MVVFDIIWNIVGILYALIGLILCSIVVFLLMAFVAGMADKAGTMKGVKEKDDRKTKK